MTATAMSVRNKGCTLWLRNKKWYRVDKQNKKYVLTNEAPQEARDSFEMYKKINKLDW